MDSNRIELDLFGEFSLTVKGESRSIPLASAKKLLVLLFLQNGKPASRARIAEKIWPGEPENATLPRLRTALTALRTALKPFDPIQGDKTSFVLQSDSIISDVEKAKSIYTQSHLLPSEHDEVEALVTFLSLANRPFCSDFADPWAAEIRTEYQAMAREAKLKIIRLTQVTGDWSLGQKWADDLVEQAHDDEEAWFSYFLLAIHFKKSDALLKKFRKAQESQAVNNLSTVSRSFVKQIDQLLSSVDSIGTLSNDQVTIVGRVIEKLIATSPEEALTFLGSVAFRDEIFLHPESAGELCLRVLDATDGYSEDRQKCITNLLVAANSMHHYDQVLFWATKLLENSSSIQRKRGSSSVIANLQFERGMYEQSFESLQLSLDYANELGDQDGITIAQGQIGLFYLRINDFQTGEPLVRQAIQKLEGSEVVQSQIACGILLKELGWVKYSHQKYDEAKENSNAALKVARVAGTQVLVAECLCQLGVIQLTQNDRKAGLESLARSAVIIYRNGEKNKQVEVIEKMAIAMSLLHRPAEARAIVELTEKYYKESGRTIYPLNQNLRKAVMESSANTKPLAEWLGHESWQTILSAVSRIFLTNSA
ncbi:MAG: hypothetical protein KF824_05320 [Fimbriimonadaceae bacterium]|nr:MAG: hypothetical protein KF824_05320 [Fimbriimonadaceae bacterium]